MINIIIGFAAGVLVGALVKPVAGYVVKGWQWIKAFVQSNKK